MVSQDPSGREAVRHRLRLAFERWGGNQAELAAQVGAARGTISDWFNPAKDAIPDGEKMARLPAVLGVNGHWLLTGEGPTVTGGDGAVTRAEHAGALKVITDLARVFEQLKLIHVSDASSVDPAVRTAMRLQLTREQADRARATPGRRKKARSRAG